MNRVVGTAGHIDHGKTALVRALTGVNTDRLPEEKRRGITIDLGFASCQIGDHHYSFVDVPGHERFVRHMVAGVTGIDTVLLVVAANDSVMPQTREHLEILRFVGVQSGIVVLTKSDLADASWLELVEEDVRGLIAGTALEGAPIVRTSTVTGEGLDQLKARLSQLETSGKSIDEPDPFRMAIDRSFTISGHGTVVTGTIASGTVSVGDELELMPLMRKVRVRSIQRHDQAVETIGRGNRAAINLVGIHHTEVHRGQELATPGYLEATQRLTVEIFAARDAPRPLRHRARYRLHLGTNEVTASLALLEAKSPEIDQPAYAQLRLAKPVVSVFGQPFILREESPPATLAGGRILEPVARGIRRKQIATIEAVRKLAAARPEARLLPSLELSGSLNKTPLELSRITGLGRDEIDRQCDGVRSGGGLIELPSGGHRTVWMTASAVSTIEERLARALTKLHEAAPRQSSIPLPHLYAAVGDLDDRTLVDAIVERMVRARRLVRDGRTIALSGHQPKLSQAERRLKAEIAEGFRVAGLAAPDISEFVGDGLSKSKQTVTELVTLLCEEQRLVKLNQELYLDFDAEQMMRGTVRDYFAEHESMTMSELRDLLKTSRKYAVPFGEYLDRIGLTRREGDVRHWSQEPVTAPGEPIHVE